MKFLLNLNLECAEKKYLVKKRNPTLFYPIEKVIFSWYDIRQMAEREIR